MNGHPLEAWADQAYRDGITSGCTTTPVRNFCPSNTITRAEIVIFLLRAKNGASYSPPAATHIFADMNGNWAEAWAEAAYTAGITSACSTNPLNFCPNSSVTRASNAVFINNTFQFVPTAFSYNGTWHKYYFAGTSRVAMRTCSGNSGTACTAPTYFLSDHLGSTSVSVNNVGTMVSTMLYSPWGQVRYSNGTTSTPYQYTGQFSNMSDFGLLYFNARWVDPLIGRFTSPDSIIPESQGVQAWDRYAFVNNNPLRYTDPTGHRNCEEDGYNCAGDAITPGELIRSDRKQNGSRCGSALTIECITRNNNLSNAIEAYMKNHPDYIPTDDELLCSGAAGNPCRDLAIFEDIRFSYWMSRAGGDKSEAYKLMYYYDFDYQTEDLKFDPSQINWASTGLDTISFTASVAALFLIPEYAIYANGLAYAAGGISGVYSLTKQDYFGAGLSGGGFIRPPLGTLASGVSVVHDFSAGFYSVPYIPSVIR